MLSVRDRCHFASTAVPFYARSLYCRALPVWSGVVGVVGAPPLFLKQRKCARGRSQGPSPHPARSRDDGDDNGAKNAGVLLACCGLYKSALKACVRSLLRRLGVMADYSEEG